MTVGSRAASSPPLAAVVGANGFIGSALCAALRRDAVPVAEFTRERSAVESGWLAPQLRDARTVYLLAGRVNPALAEQEPGAATEELAELERLLELLSDMPVDGELPRRRVVLAGSGGTVYDSGADPPYRETSPVAPVNAYGRLKLATEELVRSYDGPLEPVVTRLSNVYGPGQRLGTGQGVIGHWLAAARDGLALQLFGDPDATRDYLYVDDAVAALEMVHVAAAPVPAVLNIGSGTPTSLGELAELTRAVLGRPDLELTLVPARGFDRHDTWLDVRLARQTLGWSAHTTLKDGLAATWKAL